MRLFVRYHASFSCERSVAHDSTPCMLSQESWAVAVQRALFGLCLLVIVIDSLRGDWLSDG